jgi:transcriptional regulator with XRE-family HTH domain
MGTRRDGQREALVALVGPTTAGYIDLYAAAFLKDARIQAGLSQRELARRANVPASTVNRIELGKERLTIPLLSRLILATGLELRIGTATLRRPRPDPRPSSRRRSSASSERRARTRPLPR